MLHLNPGENRKIDPLLVVDVAREAHSKDLELAFAMWAPVCEVVLPHYDLDMGGTRG
jgi:hypothetical protein